MKGNKKKIDYWCKKCGLDLDKHDPINKSCERPINFFDEWIAISETLWNKQCEGDLLCKIIMQDNEYCSHLRGSRLIAVVSDRNYIVSDPGMDNEAYVEYDKMLTRMSDTSTKFSGTMNSVGALALLRHKELSELDDVWMPKRKFALGQEIESELNEVNITSLKSVCGSTYQNNLGMDALNFYKLVVKKCNSELTDNKFCMGHIFSHWFGGSAEDDNNIMFITENANKSHHDSMERKIKEFIRGHGILSKNGRKMLLEQRHVFVVNYYIVLVGDMEKDSIPLQMRNNRRVPEYFVGNAFIEAIKIPEFSSMKELETYMKSYQFEYTETEPDDHVHINSKWTTIKSTLFKDIIIHNK